MHNSQYFNTVTSNDSEDQGPGSEMKVGEGMERTK